MGFSKLFFPFISLTIILSAVIIGVYLTRQPQEIREKAAEEVVFSDSFERLSVFDTNWVLGSGVQADITTSTSFVHSGSRSLKIHNPGNGLTSINHNFKVPAQGTFGVYFYDYGNANSNGSLYSMSNSLVTQYLIIQLDSGKPNYTYRINDTSFDSGILRSQGWHLFEFVVTPKGSYAKIDGRSLAGISVNNDLKFADLISLGRGWGISGDTYFDDVNVRSLFILPTSDLGYFDVWSDEVYRIYKNTDLNLLINGISIRGSSDIFPNQTHKNTMIARGLADQAMMHIYYYKRNGTTSDLTRAVSLINTIADKYPLWGQTWLSSIPAYELAYDAWWIWPNLPLSTKQKLQDVLLTEANFWTGVFEEIENNKGGSTIPNEVGRRGGTNINIITSGNYLYDTRAEENAANARFLAIAYAMFPNHPSAGDWNNASRCFAFHTITRDDVYCGVPTRTVANDFTLGNHNYYPHPIYTVAALTSLQQSQSVYDFASITIPSEFNHNISTKTQSGLWQRNIANCMDSNFSIVDACSVEGDTGDKNMQVSTFILAYWKYLNNDSASTTLLKNMLDYFYYIHKDLIRYPYVNPVAQLNPDTADASQWITNLERHTQMSAKIYGLINGLTPITPAGFLTPNCILSGPTEANIGETKAYSITCGVSGNNFSESRILWRTTVDAGPNDDGSGGWQYVICSGSGTCSADIKWNNIGTYYVSTDAHTSSGGFCSGNPWCEWLPNPPYELKCYLNYQANDCGPKDTIIVTVSNVTPTPTFTPTPTPTPTNTPTPTPTRTPTPTLSPTPTNTPTPTKTPTPTPTPTFTPTSSPTLTLTPTPVRIIGDANGDGKVDIADYFIWLSQYSGMSSPGPTNDADFNNDGRVDGVDYMLWFKNFGR